MTDRMAIAIYEAGHCVAAWAVGSPVARLVTYGCWVEFDRTDPKALRRKAVVGWSGPLAQHRYQSIPPEQQAAMWHTVWSSDWRTLQLVDERVRAAAHKRADRILLVHWASVLAVADALLDHGELYRHQIDALIKETLPVLDARNYAACKTLIVDSLQRL